MGPVLLVSPQIGLHTMDFSVSTLEPEIIVALRRNICSLDTFPVKYSGFPLVGLHEDFPRVKGLGGGAQGGL